MRNYNLEDAIIQLHDVARTVERDIGYGTLAEDIRKSANRLSELIHAVGINVNAKTEPELFKQLNGALDEIHGL